MPISVAPGKTHQRSSRERFQDVVEQSLHAGGKDFFFALLGVVALHDANASERFGQPSGDFGGDFRARAENRANRRERFADAKSRRPEESRRPRRSSVALV